MGTYEPMDPDKMNGDQKRQAMQSLLMISKKRDMRIKSRLVADRSVQRRHPGYKKEDSAAPTILTDMVFIARAIEAWDERIFDCFDILGAFLYADCKEGHTYMKLRGKLAELTVLIKPKLHCEYARYPNRHAKLYVRMINALYSTLKITLWFYEKVGDNLKADGFIINNYDPCIANKIVNGTQMTVT